MNWRLRIFNWFACGRISLSLDQKEKGFMAVTQPQTSYTIAGSAGIGSGLRLSSGDQSSFVPEVTIRITSANGGSIISVNRDFAQAELYIIPDGSNFDTELGKIITMAKLKS